MIRTPLRYPGGKSKALRSIAERLPKSFEEFREPFVGGGSVFLYARQHHPEARFWINDFYEPLFLFWKHLRDHPEEVLAQVRTWKSTYSDGRALHALLTSDRGEWSEVERAAAFFVLNRITFSGTSDSGGYSNQAFLKRFTDSSIERAERVAPLLQGVRITRLDYEEVVLAPGKDVFLFLDPPYHSATTSALYGRNGHLHKAFDHERFAEVMRRCPHRWLITYDDSPYIRQLFSFARIREWKLTYGMRNVTPTPNQRATEIFVSNF